MFYTAVRVRAPTVGFVLWLHVRRASNVRRTHAQRRDDAAKVVTRVEGETPGATVHARLRHVELELANADVIVIDLAGRLEEFAHVMHAPQLALVVVPGICA